MDAVVCVSSGAIVGSLLRYKTTLFASKYGFSVPFTTAFINITGSFLLGALAAKTRRPQTSLLLGTGFCGSLTTFSTFSVDALQFIDAKRVGMALVYVSVTNVGGIGAAAIAYKLFKQAK